MSAFARLLKTPANREPVKLPESELSPGMNIVGVLDCDGAVIVRGNIHGRVNADQLFIAPDGYVEGDVVAREVFIWGQFHGRVYAHSVKLEPSANVTGRLFHHVISVASGARFDGRMPWRPLNYFEALDQLPEVQT